MKVLCRDPKSSELRVKTLVLVATELESKKKVNIAGIDAKLNEMLGRALEEKVFSGKTKETLLFREANLMGATHILVVGAGAASNLNAESMRVAAAVTLSSLKETRSKSAAIQLEALLKGRSDVAQLVQGFTEGLLLTNYEFEEHKFASKDSLKKETSLNEITLILPSLGKDIKETVSAATVLGEATNLCRWLGDHSGNTMTPTMLADQVVRAAKGSGLKVTVWEKKKIEKERFGGLMTVSKGSAEEPRFIIMEYMNAPKSKKPVVLVGKGLTFDSGGISIKPSPNMDEMKYDMCGGAAVISTMIALAKLKARVNVIGLVPASENMPGPNAVKPGDIMVTRSGKTVEVLNTDAEGRLILSDAIVYASEQKPAAVFTIATLTGAIVVALGNSFTGTFTRNKKLMERIQKAADQTGEMVWPMPIHDHHVSDIKGYHADLANISSFKGAGSSTAAAFLEQFVGDGLEFAHFDIAGTAWNVSNRFPYAPKRGASGAMVRTLVALTESYFTTSKQ